MDFEESFEFSVSDAHLEFDGAPEVHRVILETDDAPKGKITIKPRKEVQEKVSIEGMPGTDPSEEMYETTELPSNIQNVVRQAQDEEITCTATVGMNEDDHMFILDEHIETLEPKLLQDDRDE